MTAKAAWPFPGSPVVSVADLKLVKTRNVKTPCKATPGSACFDIFVPDDHEPITIEPGKTGTFKTGLKVAIPEGWVMLINSRSGMGFKHQVRLSNCQGVIDSDYREEIGVQLFNDNTDTPVSVNPGDRIAQFWLQPVWSVEIEEVEGLDETERKGGFGSTGGFSG